MSREITEGQRSWLAGELDAWRDRGIVSADQVEGVLGLYASVEEFHERRQSKAFLTLLSLASLLIGLAVLLLIGYNWEDMPAAAKVTAVFGAVVAAHGLGLTLRFKLGQRGASEAAFFFGCLLYGMGIWLLAQIFQVSGHYPDGFWWWALGVLPFALACESLVMHVLLVALLATWVGTEILGFASMGAWLFGRIRVVPNGAYSLLLFAAPCVWWAYRKGSAKAVGLYVPLIAWWVILQPFAWGLNANPVYFIGAVGGLLLLAAEAHRPGSAMAVPYRFYGASLVAGVLVPLSYHDFNRMTVDPMQGLAALYQTIAVAVLAVVVLAEVVFARRRRDETGSYLQAMIGVARRQWVPCTLIAVMAGLGIYQGVFDEPLAPTIAANLAMVALSLRLMQTGLQEDRGRPFAAGVMYFLLWAVLRYIDLFGAFGGMLGGALMFFLCGATLLGVAYFWRHRKAVPHG